MALGENQKSIQIMRITTYDAYTRLSPMDVARLARFIHAHQDAPHTTKRAIGKAIEYSAKEIPGLGGYVFVLQEKEEILGLMVVNKTGMGDYIPENFIAFLTIHREHLEAGFEQALMDYALQYCKGDIAIHIKTLGRNMEFLQRNGFELTHMEMRLKR